MAATDPRTPLPMAILLSVTGLDGRANIFLTMYGLTVNEYLVRPNRATGAGKTHDEVPSIALSH